MWKKLSPKSIACYFRIFKAAINAEVTIPATGAKTVEMSR
jgi:hypothetical protein